MDVVFVVVGAGEDPPALDHLNGVVFSVPPPAQDASTDLQRQQARGSPLPWCVIFRRDSGRVSVGCRRIDVVRRLVVGLQVAVAARSVVLGR